MKRSLKYCFLLIFIFGTLHAHNAPNIKHVIIDTDCSADDLRAITMFLAISHVEIEAFIAAEGTLTPIQGVEKIEQLNNYFESEIPVGIGEELNIPAPEWREMNLSIPWGNEPTKDNDIHQPAIEVLDEAFHHESHLTYIALGPLTNLADFLDAHPEDAHKIEKIIWYCSGKESLSGFNYSTDIISADKILLKKINVEIISLQADLSFDKTLLNNIKTIDNKFSSLISLSHTSSEVYKKIETNHLKIWDDLVPIYFLYPELFTINPDLKIPKIKYCSEINAQSIQRVIPDILNQTYHYIENIVFNEFPEDSKLFRYDLQVYMDSIIQKYGELEWKTCVITNEFHGHLGIYSLIGAKMGIKAREILNAPIDRLEVVSFAGNKPPISCFTDGLQVSTGATLGQGTIQISDEELKRPEAIFIHEQDTINMKLKDEYWNAIKDDISKGIVEYGMQSDGYWKFIRKLAIEYWYEFDRNEIFEITKMK